MERNWRTGEVVWRQTPRRIARHNEVVKCFAVNRRNCAWNVCGGGLNGFGGYETSEKSKSKAPHAKPACRPPTFVLGYIVRATRLAPLWGAQISSSSNDVTPSYPFRYLSAPSPGRAAPAPFPAGAS